MPQQPALPDGFTVCQLYFCVLVTGTRIWSLFKRDLVSVLITLSVRRVQTGSCDEIVGLLTDSRERMGGGCNQILLGILSL